jgi:hypothetical protein
MARPHWAIKDEHAYFNLTTVVWLVSAPFSMFVHQKLVRNPHNNAETKKGISWPLISSQ